MTAFFAFFACYHLDAPMYMFIIGFLCLAMDSCE